MEFVYGTLVAVLPAILWVLGKQPTGLQTMVYILTCANWLAVKIDKKNQPQA